MKAIVALTACAGFVVACSATNGDNAASSGSAVHSEDGVCSTIDYHHTQSNAAFYRQFDSNDKAFTFMKKLATQGQFNGVGGPGTTVREITSDERLNRLVGEVWQGYKVAYPVETDGMNAPPRIAILESTQFNAFAMGPNFTDDPSRPPQSPWIFVVLGGVLTNNNTDNELRGLFAHEMGHLILRTFLPDIRAQVRTAYVLHGSENGVLGASQDNDARVAAHVEDIATRQMRVGGTPEIGMSFVIPPLYTSLMKQMVSMARQTPAGQTACADWGPKATAYAQAQVALMPNVAGDDFSSRTPTAAEKTHLADLWTGVEGAVRSCFGTLSADDQNLSLAGLYAELNGLPESAVNPTDPNHAALLDMMLEAEQTVDQQQPHANLLERMLAADAPIRSEMVRLETDASIPIDSIRVYDFEEDADDAAVRVLAAINQDPTGGGQLMLSSLKPEVAAKCKADVEAGKPIGYGRFIDVHPASCWRYYHSVQFSKALSQCAPGVRMHIPSKGTGIASVLDRRDGLGKDRLF